MKKFKDFIKHHILDAQQQCRLVNIKIDGIKEEVIEKVNKIYNYETP